jgi:hypothetical protein
MKDRRSCGRSSRGRVVEGKLGSFTLNVHYVRIEQRFQVLNISGALWYCLRWREGGCEGVQISIWSSSSIPRESFLLKLRSARTDPPAFRLSRRVTRTQSGGAA